jgi:hypothetical protein
MRDKSSLVNDIKSLKKFEIMPVAVERSGQFHIDDKVKAITIENENEIIATVSTRYKLIQFADVFLPAIAGIPDFEGDIDTYKGKANLFVFPTNLANPQHRIGVLLRNSVDKSSAIEIKFCVCVNNYFITIPNQIRQFRKVHIGRALSFTQDFLNGLSNIQDTWNTIVEKYKSYNIDTEIVENICKELKLTKKARERVSSFSVTNLWELFIVILDQITRKRYRSEIHKQRKIEKISQLFYQYTIGANL